MIWSDACRVRGPEMLDVSHGYRIQLRAGNDVTGEWRAGYGFTVRRCLGTPGIVNRAQAARVIEGLRKIAGTLQIGGKRLDQGLRVRLLPTLVRYKIKELI